MTITEAARNKVDQVLNGDGFLEIYLQGGGCSGYQIKLKGTSEIPSEAKMLTDTIFSDADSLDLLGDAVMDWNDDPFKPSLPLYATDGIVFLRMRIIIHNITETA